MVFMHRSHLYQITMDLLSRSGGVTAVATLLVLSPSNSFGLPAGNMATHVATGAVRYLGSEDFLEARQTGLATASVADQATQKHRPLFETDGWTVVRYTEQPTVAH